MVSTVTNNVNPKDTEVQIKDFKASILPTQARYIKVKAYNFGKLPSWHQGVGGDAYIFVDEISAR